jgi:hypothetical protein
VFQNRSAAEADVLVTPLVDGDGHELADLQFGQAGLLEPTLLDVVLEADGELRRLVQRLLDPHLDDAGQQVVREQAIVRAARYEEVEAHQPSLGIDTVGAASTASGRIRPA